MLRTSLVFRRPWGLHSRHFAVKIDQKPKKGSTDPPTISASKFTDVDLLRCFGIKLSPTLDLQSVLPKVATQNHETLETKLLRQANINNVYEAYHLVTDFNTPVLLRSFLAAYLASYTFDEPSLDYASLLFLQVVGMVPPVYNIKPQFTMKDKLAICGVPTVVTSIADQVIISVESKLLLLQNEGQAHKSDHTAHYRGQLGLAMLSAALHNFKTDNVGPGADVTIYQAFWLPGKFTFLRGDFPTSFLCELEEGKLPTQPISIECFVKTADFPALGSGLNFFDTDDRSMILDAYQQLHAWCGQEKLTKG